MRPLVVASVQVRDLRNLTRVDATFGARFNVISGNNGQGKTNLLEAIYLVATSKSFRASRLSELVSTGAEVGSVRAIIEEDGVSREQSVGVKHGSRSVKIDDKRPRSLADYAVRTPVVVFHPGEIALSMGGSAERRRLLDRAALYLEPEALEDLDAYVKSTRSRQRILETRGPGSADLDAWESLSVKHGLSLMRRRARAAGELSVRAASAFERIAAPGLALGCEYLPSAPDDESSFLRELSARRAQDARRGSASVGPHRDELTLRIGAHLVRGFASQGQHRAVTLALKAAEIEVAGMARGVHPVLLLDDVSSELDRERTSALFSFLRAQEGQVFLTTTRPDLIDTGEGSVSRVDFSVQGGSVSRLVMISG